MQAAAFFLLKSYIHVDLFIEDRMHVGYVYSKEHSAPLFFVQDGINQDRISSLNLASRTY